jgi:hypothetical protein
VARGVGERVGRLKTRGKARRELERRTIESVSYSEWTSEE